MREKIAPKTQSGKGRARRECCQASGALRESSEKGIVIAEISPRGHTGNVAESGPPRLAVRRRQMRQ